jgi:hypothetical protein
MNRVIPAASTVLLMACGGATKDPAASQRIRQLAVGREQVCVVRESGALECFATGGSLADAVSPLAGRFKRVSVGYVGGAALREDGVVQYWGVDDDTLPTGRFTELVNDGSAACGIRSDGSVECGGLDGTFERAPLPGRFTQVVLVATGGVCGVTDSGLLLCHQPQPWYAPPPDGLDDLTSVAVELTASAGGCGLTRAGALRCWGEVCPAPGAYRAVTLTHLDTCAIAESGDLECWPNARCDSGSLPTSSPSKMPPPGAHGQLAASLEHTCAVNAAADDVLCW